MEPPPEPEDRAIGPVIPVAAPPPPVTTSLGGSDAGRDLGPDSGTTQGDTVSQHSDQHTQAFLGTTEFSMGDEEEAMEVASTIADICSQVQTLVALPADDQDTAEATPTKAHGIKQWPHSGGCGSALFVLP